MNKKINLLLIVIGFTIGFIILTLLIFNVKNDSRFVDEETTTIITTTSRDVKTIEVNKVSTTHASTVTTTTSKEVHNKTELVY